MNLRFSARTGQPIARLSAGEIRGLLEAGLIFAAGALLILAVALLGRRLAGGPTEPLSLGAFFVAGLLMSGALVGLRAAWFSLGARRDTSLLDAALSLPTIAAVILGVAITGPPGRDVAFLGYWLPVLVAESWTWISAHRHSMVELPAETEAENAAEIEREMESAEEPLEEAALPENATQRWIRSADTHGSETIRGSLRGVAIGGERSLSLHIAFCPPLATRPEITAELICESPGSVVIGQAEVYGARFDVKFAGAASAGLEAIVEFKAISAATS